jgi:hypothetical protein
MGAARALIHLGNPYIEVDGKSADLEYTPKYVSTLLDIRRPRRGSESGPGGRQIRYLHREADAWRAICYWGGIDTIPIDSPLEERGSRR